MGTNDDRTPHDLGGTRRLLDRAREELGDMERRLRRKMRLHPKGNTPEPGADSESSPEPVGADEKAA
ncbi:MAG TPA: hypothetical protein VFU76_13450 [Terriglobales bacterium]|nr:hypothetical protein [Terriglobales bacterium]